MTALDTVMANGSTAGNTNGNPAIPLQILLSQVIVYNLVTDLAFIELFE